MALCDAMEIELLVRTCTQLNKNPSRTYCFILLVLPVRSNLGATQDTATSGCISRPHYGDPSESHDLAVVTKLWSMMCLLIAI